MNCISIYISGEKGDGEATGKPLHYHGVIFHRVIKKFMIQAGDFVNGKLKSSRFGWLYSQMQNIILLQLKLEFVGIFYARIKTSDSWKFNAEYKIDISQL